ncbi:MAG: glycosyltransferase family 39 protein [Verrucomicrobia bacterium]|nr:glycosyltransferase family 39 protein [Verrucomicrobiota bacterium]
MNRKQTGWVIIGLVVATWIQRGLLAVLGMYLSDDAGTVALMALDILKGARPLFLYGFPYSGALQAYLVAGSFAIFGIHTFSFVLPTLLLTSAWVVVTYGLFRELYGSRTGLAAALLVIFADWITTWYTMIPDCSYSPLFFLGTAALWLTVRIVSTEGATHGRWAIPSLGLVAGLGLWVHPLMAVYLVPAAPFHGVYLWRQRKSGPILRSYLYGGLLMAVALLPYLLAHDAEVQGPGSLWDPGWQTITRHASLLVAHQLPTLIQWPLSWAPALQSGLYVLLLLALLLLVLYFICEPTWSRFLRGLLPMLFLACFLGFYLPHPMAGESTLRYLIPFWTMAAALLFAVPLSHPNRRLRGASLALLVVWLGYHAAGVVGYSLAMRPVRERHHRAHQQLVDHARAVGLQTVVLVGDFHEISMACALRYLARNDIRFVAAHTERDYTAYLQAEADTHVGFASASHESSLLRETLRQVGASFDWIEGEGFDLACHLSLPTRDETCLLPAAMTVRVDRILGGESAWLVDRDLSTGCRGNPVMRGSITIELDQPRTIGAILLSGLQGSEIPDDQVLLPQTDPVHGGLPGAYALEGSLDGETYFLLHRGTAVFPVAYIDGPRLFVESGLPRQEIRFEPRPVRTLRYTPKWSKIGGASWTISEIFVFEDLGPLEPDWLAEVDGLAEALANHHDTATIGDRWISAQLAEQGFAGLRPPHRHLQINNPGYRDIVPIGALNRRTALVLRASLVPELLARWDDKTGKKILTQASGNGYYRVLRLAEPMPDPSTLPWIGPTAGQLSSKE